MEQNNQYQSPTQRIGNIREVALGLAKKISQERARRCPQCAKPTCMDGCPLGVDIPSFIRHLREGDATGALTVILQHNPFPAICGRVCHAPCETACIFAEDGTPITIRDLERFASDHGNWKTVKRVPQSSIGKKVAIIGGGMTGLTLAHQLVMTGVSVDIFEAADDVGGLMRYAIPEFRLPMKVVDETVNHLKQSGVRIHTNQIFGRTITMSELLMQGFHAIALTVGAGVPKFIDGINDQAIGFYYHSEFLSRVQRLSKNLVLEPGQRLLFGPKSVVLAKTIQAFDAARMLRRLGQQVTICWLGEETELLKAKLVVDQSVEEGIEVKEAIQLKRVLIGERNEIVGVELEDLVEGQLITLQASQVIAAFGLQPNQFIRQHLPQLRFNEDGTVWVDDQTSMTSVEKVFACGDIASGPSSLVDAINQGKKTASLLIKFLEK